MDFIKYELDLNTGNAVSVELNGQANVKLMDHSNFQAYRSGRKHTYYGRLATISPYIVRPPHGGRWYLAIDLGGHSGRINSSVSII